MAQFQNDARSRPLPLSNPHRREEISESELEQALYRDPTDPEVAGALIYRLLLRPNSPLKRRLTGGWARELTDREEDLIAITAMKIHKWLRRGRLDPAKGSLQSVMAKTLYHETHRRPRKVDEASVSWDQFLAADPDALDTYFVAPEVEARIERAEAKQIADLVLSRMAQTDREILEVVAHAPAGGEIAALSQALPQVRRGTIRVRCHRALSRARLAAEGVEADLKRPRR